MKKSIIFSFLIFASPVISTVSAESMKGTVYFAKRYEMGFLVSGEVKKVSAEIGQLVKKKHILISLDATPFNIAIDQATANVKFYTINRKKKLRDYKQGQELYDLAAISIVELENTKIEFESIDARYNSALAKLKNAQYNLQQSFIISPFDALVLDIRTHTGQRIVNTFTVNPVIVFAAIGEYSVRILVPITTLVTINQPVAVTIQNTKFNGSIKTITYEPVKTKNTKEKLYEIRIDFKVKDSILRTGLTALVEL